MTGNDKLKTVEYKYPNSRPASSVVKSTIIVPVFMSTIVMWAIKPRPLKSEKK